MEQKTRKKAGKKSSSTAVSPSGKKLSSRSSEDKYTYNRSRSVKKSSAVKYPRRELISIGMLFLSIIMVLSYYVNAFGIVGRFIKSLGCVMMGASAYAIPAIIIIATVHLFIRGTLEPHIHRYVFAGLCLFCISGLHTLYYTTVEPELFSADNFEIFSLIDTIFPSGRQCLSGGFIGALLALPLRALVSETGAAVILICMTLVCTVTTTGTEPITRFAGFVMENFTALLERRSEEREKRETNKEIKVKYEKENKKGKKDDGETHEEFSGEQIKIKGFEEFDSKEGKKTDNEDDSAGDGLKIHLFDKNHDEKNPKEDLEGKAEIPEDIEEAAIEASGGVKKEKKDMDAIEVTDDEIESDYIEYIYPPIDLLSKEKISGANADRPDDLRAQAKKLVDTLHSFGVEAKVLEVSKGPSVTRFEIQPAVGVKVSKIVNLADDIALNLAAIGVRIEAPIPGKAAVGIEIPNKNTSMVRLREVIDSDAFRNSKYKTAFAMGKNIDGMPVVSDISKMPHMLIAGATGSGKSVCINSLITSVLYKADPNQVKLILIDPKVVELGVYNGIPHLLIPVVTDPRRAAGALNWAVQEMVKRYKLFADTNVRDIKGYNEYAAINGERELEKIIIIIDELADLMMVSPRDVEDSICRLAQMARAAGMHLVIATQRPSVDVITGLIKANVPSRIAFCVSSQIDSRTILDMGGAEKLLGKGDMLYLPMGASKPTRIQGAFVSDEEVEKIVAFVKEGAEARYDEDIMEHIENGTEEAPSEDNDSDADELLPNAMEIVVELGQASTSLLQRKLKVGYSRAGRLVDQLEERGIIGPSEGSKPRRVLISKSELMELNASKSE